LTVNAHALTTSTTPAIFPQNSRKDPLKRIYWIEYTRGILCDQLPNDQTIAITYEIEKDLSTCNCNSFSFIYWHIYFFAVRKAPEWAEIKCQNPHSIKLWAIYASLRLLYCGKAQSSDSKSKVELPRSYANGNPQITWLRLCWDGQFWFFFHFFHSYSYQTFIFACMQSGNRVEIKISALLIFYFPPHSASLLSFRNSLFCTYMYRRWVDRERASVIFDVMHNHLTLSLLFYFSSSSSSSSFHSGLLAVS